MFTHQPAQGRVALALADAQHFGKLAVQVRADGHVRVHEEPLIRFEMIGQRQRDRVAGAFEDFDMQVAVPGHSRTKAPVETLEFGNQTQEPEVIALIQGHKTDEATWLRDRFRDQV